MNITLFLRLLDAGLRSHGFAVSDFAHRQVERMHVFSFVFHCPCGRPLLESWSATDYTLYGLRGGELSYAVLVSGHFRRELQSHIDGEVA